MVADETGEKGRGQITKGLVGRIREPELGPCPLGSRETCRVLSREVTGCQVCVFVRSLWQWYRS